MPTVLRVGPYRFYFYSHDLINEPPHVHVDREVRSAKFWLDPVGVAKNLGYGANELRRLERMVATRQSALLERWYQEYGRATR
jgi:hypothetical protein